MKRILILGSGTQQLPAIRAARNLHIHATVFDRNTKALGNREAHRFLPIDIYDEDSALAKAQELHQEITFDGVMTMGTDCSTTVARIAEALALPGIDYKSASILKDKAEFRRFCQEHNLPIPRFAVFATNTEGLNSAVNFFNKEGFTECVLKPTRNMGARGVCIVRSEIDIERVFNYARHFASSGYMLIEEKIDIPEYSVDAFVIDGRVHILGIADRFIALDPNRIELGHTLPAHMDAQGLDMIKELFQTIAGILKIEAGALKGDIFYDKSTVVLGELAGRLSGGYMSGWTIPLAYGIKPAEIAVLTAIGKTPSYTQIAPNRANYAAEQAIISMPGIMYAIVGNKTCIQNTWCKHIFLMRRIGERVPFPRNNTEKVGNVIFTATTRQKLEEHRRYIATFFQVHLKPCVDETTRFLFAHEVEVDLPSLGCALPPVLQSYRETYLFPESILPWNEKRFTMCLDYDLYSQYKEYKRQHRTPVTGHGKAETQKTDALSEEGTDQGSLDQAEETTNVFFSFLNAAESEALVSIRQGAIAQADILLFHAIERGGMQALRYMQESVQYDTTESFTQLCYELYLQRFS